MIRSERPRRAVALRWDGRGAPRVTAKGRDELAERIVAVARAADVPVRHDAPLVRLLSDIPLGEEIPEVLYRAVAVVLAYAYHISGRRPPGSHGGAGSGTMAP